MSSNSYYKIELTGNLSKTKQLGTPLEKEWEHQEKESVKFLLKISQPDVPQWEQNLNANLKEAEVKLKHSVAKLSLLIEEQMAHLTFKVYEPKWKQGILNEANQ